MSNITAASDKKQEKKSTRVDVRKLTVTALLAAVSTVLMFFEFSLPMLIPSFIKMDFSELPALLAAFAYGPVSGIAVCLVKNLINLTTSGSGGIGELSNFILGCAFVIPAGMLYKRRKTRKCALLGSLIGAFSMAIISLFSNYYIVYPIYTNIMPMDTIIAAYSAILPSVTNLWQALLVFNLPFTFIKGMICVAAALVIYKPLSPILKGKRNI